MIYLGPSIPISLVMWQLITGAPTIPVLMDSGFCQWKWKVDIKVVFQFLHMRKVLDRLLSHFAKYILTQQYLL